MMINYDFHSEISTSKLIKLTSLLQLQTNVDESVCNDKLDHDHI